MLRYFLLLFLMGCASVHPYYGTELHPVIHEDFVGWEDDFHTLCKKKLRVNNPLDNPVVVHLN